MKKVKYLTLVPLVALGICVVGGCGTPKGTGYEGYKTYGEKIEDGKIIARIRNDFRTNSAIPDDLIYLSIDRNVVQLSGFIRTPEEANLAVLSAKRTPGVKDVINNLIVLTDPEYAARRARAEAYDTRR